MPLRLSAALIVKDEAQHLPGCLHSLESWVDETCVVDTGSSDATREIAHEAGCRVAEFPWCGDFAAARNAALSMCRGQWILVMDADERLAPEDGPVLRELLDGDPAIWYSFVTRTYTYDTRLSDFVYCEPGDPHAHGYWGWYPSVKVRLFANAPENRFVGRVHEVLRCHGAAGHLRVVPCAIPIHHYPLERSGDAVARKQQLYLALGLQKVAENPDYAPAWAELAVQHAELGEHAEAVAAYRRALSIEGAHGEWLRELGSLLHLQGHGREASAALALAVQVTPADAVAWRNWGVVHASSDRWPDALACFERSLNLAPKDAQSHQYAALALERLGRFEEALCEARLALGLFPQSIEAQDLLRHLAARAGEHGTAGADTD